MAAARVIEMIAGARRAPVGKNTHETTGLDRCFHLIFRKVAKPKALERRVLYLRNSVERDAPLNADFQLPATLPEFPRIKCTVGGQAQIDAGMLS